MKKLIALLVLVAGGYFAYQYLQKGEVEILDKGEKTPAQLELQRLEEQFNALRQRYEEGDFTAVDIEAARAEADQIRDELQKLKPQLTSTSDQTKVGSLGLAIRKFKDEVL
jgi:Tfp pilus assembly protein PilO